MKKFLIVPSILSANFCHLGREIKTMMHAGCNLIHFDVMDNHYVPNLTMGPMILESIKKNKIQVLFDVHLMASPVDSLIPLFYDLNVKFITVHPESTIHLDKTIQLIKKIGCGVGIALNPATSLHYLDYIMGDVDLILIMTVNPGFGGQTFLPYILKKIQQVRYLIDKNKKSVILSVDGGINLSNIVQIIQSGADYIVIGSALFHSQNYLQAIQDFKDIVV
ncbi:Ribulose-phosphate 3-epimerase [Buchnera aphidicola (Cinara kochiana kochiana)]|uniref:Ribulose-phosphate 3-epimerase n=1 Tax=Buchnera aphidicola (Cinara kochiana kochiana) TaxID=2518976 RepID=A0A451D606_9GAMM|nr:ribulose-phosphate 3-epimerase [Buchnera aphidicola]VFP81258.1 Ribulose-phosphate 3-epimerase [Buchnera aphidicola (Cinara kochiana kochiana)]